MDSSDLEKDSDLESDSDDETDVLLRDSDLEDSDLSVDDLEKDSDLEDGPVVNAEEVSYLELTCNLTDNLG